MTLDEYFQQSQELEREYFNKRRQLDEKHTKAVNENANRLSEEKLKLFQQVTDSPIGDIVEFTQLSGNRMLGLIVGVSQTGSGMMYDYVPIPKTTATVGKNALKSIITLGHMELDDEILRRFNII